MRPTEELKEDHQVIIRMCGVIRGVAHKLESGAEVPAQVMADIIDFIRNFADRCHHGKEEEIFFERIVQRGIPKEGGPVAVMLMEHEEGRRFLQGMSDAHEAYGRGDDAARAAFARNALAYADLLLEHINKEDNILYPMADQVLTDEDQQDLAREFDAVEHERLGHDEHERYEALVERLEQEYVDRAA